MAGSLLGIDVGCSTIKLVELSGARGSLKLERMAVAETPPDAYDAGTILDPVALGRAISEMMTQARMTARRAAVSLGGAENCKIRVERYGRMVPKDLKAAIEADAQRVFAFGGPSEQQLGYHITDTGDGDSVEAILAAARTQHLLDWCKVLNQAKLQPAVFDVSVLAQVISIIETANRPERCILVVDIGQRSCTGFVVQGGALRFVRPPGEEIHGQRLTDVVRMTVKPDTEAEAEQMKVTLGSVSLEDGFGTTDTYADDFLGDDTFTMGVAEDISDEPEDLIISVGDEAAGDQTVVMGGEADLFGDLGGPSDAAMYGTPDEEAADAEAPALGEEPAAAAEATQPEPEPALDEFTLEDDGFAVEGGGFQEGNEDSWRQDIAQAMVEPMAALASWMRETIEHYRTRHQDVDVEKIIVLGGTALLPNLPEFIERELGVPVEVGNPLATVAVDSSVYPEDYVRSQAPRLAAAVGMAARELV